MAFSNGYTIGFAAAICVVCALGVSSAALSLRDFQEANKESAFQGKVLTALGVPEKGELPSGEARAKLYEERVELLIIDGKGEVVDKTYDDVIEARKAVKGTKKPPGLYPVYIRRDGEGIGAYAIELQGKGLWGPLSGFLALEPDGGSVLGATFDAPKETPGLGAEIMANKFRDPWSGKRIHDGQRFVPIEVVKGKAELGCPGRVDYCVDGVSGATITSRGVDDMVDDAIDYYEPYLEQIRSGGGS